MALDSPRITQLDSLTHVCYAANSAYIFSRKNGVASKWLYRLNSSHTEEQLFDVTTLQDQSASSAVDGVIPVWDSTIFMVVKDFAINKSYLFKSVDNGSNWGTNSPAYDNLQYVTKIGASGATHAADIGILGTRGFCVATISSARRLIFGEYNVNGSRSPGGTNDWVRLFHSSDDGDTWSVLSSWNTNGTTRNVRHIHAVIQDPSDGLIYVGFGDSAAESGIIQWDGAGTWTDNVAPKDYSGTGFRKVGGAGRHRCVDLIFTTDYVYCPADESNPGNNAERGIWRFPRDMSSYTRVDSQSTNLDGHSMYWSLETSDGRMFAVELLEGGVANDQQMFAYTSNVGQKWRRSPIFAMTGSVAVNRAPSGLFEWNGKIYLSTTRAAGASTLLTKILQLAVAPRGPGRWLLLGAAG